MKPHLRRTLPALMAILVVAACGGDGSDITLPRSATSATTTPVTTPQTTATTIAVTTTTIAPTTTAASTTTTTAATTTTAGAAGPALLPFETAYYDEFDLESGFSPDPWQYPESVNAGSNDPVDVSYLGSGCVGYANDIPDFEVDFTAGTYDLLRFYFVADDPAEDATLIINAPDGSWHCNDDSFDTRNPSVDFSPPLSGVYDVWIGTYSEGELVAGTLSITEIDANHP